jgi:hypothetical protein
MTITVSKAEWPLEGRELTEPGQVFTEWFQPPETIKVKSIIPQVDVEYGFGVLEVTVGNLMVLYSSWPLPWAALREVDMPTCHTALRVLIKAKNISKAPMRFSATAKGLTVEGYGG